MKTEITPKVRMELAEKVGINEQYLYQCLTGRAEMDPREAARVERETRKKLTRQMLCTKTWATTWPELAKRKAKQSPVSVEVAQ